MSNDDLTATYTGYSRLRSSQGDISTDVTNYYSTVPIDTEPYDQPPNVDPAANDQLHPNTYEEMDYYYDPSLELRNTKSADLKLNRGVKKTDFSGLGKPTALEDGVTIEDVTSQFSGLSEADDTWEMGNATMVASEYDDTYRGMAGFGDAFESELENYISEQPEYDLETPQMVMGADVATLNPSLYEEYAGNAVEGTPSAVEGLSSAEKRSLAEVMNELKSKGFFLYKVILRSDKVALQDIYRALKARGFTVKILYKDNKAHFMVASQHHMNGLGVLRRKTSKKTPKKTTKKVSLTKAGAKSSGILRSIFVWPLGKPGPKGFISAFKLIGNMAFMGGVMMLLLKFAPTILKSISGILDSILGMLTSVGKYKYFKKQMA